MCCCCSVSSVVSDSLWLHGPWPARLLCPWDSPGKNTGVGCHFLFQRNITLNYKKQLKCKQDTAICHGLLLYSHSVMSDSVTPWTEAHQASWSSTTSWSLLKLMCTVDDAIQPCHPLLSPSPPGLNLSQHQFFPVSQLFTSGGQSIGLSASTLVLPMNIQGWFPLGLTGLISLLSKGLARVFSRAAVQKLQFFSAQPSLWSNFNIQTRLLEKPYIWLYGLLSARRCFCFLIHCLKLQSLATWCEQLTHWKRPWCWERLKAEEEGDRGWDGWMASQIQQTQTWANLGRWEGQWNLACCSPWGRKRWTWLGNWTTTTRFVIALLPRITHLLVSELQSPSAVILEPKKINSHCFHFFPQLFAMQWWEPMPRSYFFEHWILSQLFYSPLVPWLRRLFSSSSLSSMRVVWSAYLRLLFLLAILIPACVSSSPAFCMMYILYIS